MSSRETPARDRLLEAATRLFYQEGLGVSVRRLFQEAGVSNEALLGFGGKPWLQRAALDRWGQQWRAMLAASIQDRPATQPRLLRLLDAVEEWLIEQDYRGSFLLNARIERPQDAHIGQIVEQHRRELRSFLERLARDDGAQTPSDLADQLLVVIDGAIAAATQDRSVTPFRHAQAVAAQLLRAATTG
jgi:AcrR family transcriptional regulator